MSQDTNPQASPAAPDKPQLPTPVRTQHTLQLASRTLKYTVTTGLMPLVNKEGETQASIFFMAYTLDEPTTGVQRPLTFAFNGGPGSASIWLHLGALGPWRVRMEDEGWMPAPPFRLVENEQTWLDQTDIVFVDPVGTGYSRAAKDEYNKQYWNVKGDLEACGEFIRLYLTRYQRWASPLFLAGESYGTTRAAGLAGHLIDKGIAFNGIVLVSTVMNFLTLSFDRGNDMPYALYLPTYAATAWYHHKLPGDLQGKPLAEVLREAEAYARTEYLLALMQGDRLPEDDRARVVAQLARYTGLESRYIELANLRIHIMRFCKELLRDQRRTVGRLDSRFEAVGTSAVAEFPEFDPSLNAILPPYTAMFNAYVRGQLGYETDLVYEPLSFTVNQGWEWPQGEYTDTSDALRSAYAKNPHMKVLVAQGYYDLATPHMAAEYTLSHMELPPAAHDQITYTYYEAGHMFYLDVTSLERFRADVAAFYRDALG